MKRFALIALVFGFVGCNKIDNEKLEGLIKSGLSEKKIVVKSVTCPKDRKAKKGDKFDCNVKSDSQDLVIHVEQTDDDGTVSWALDGLIVNEKELGDKLEHQIGEGADIVCGDVVKIYKAGDKFTCEIKHGGDDTNHHVELTLKEDGGAGLKLVP